MKHWHKITLIFLFVIGLITAWKSSGFYHGDEHYQIIEFAGLKLGTHETNEVAWEYQHKMRPAIQVFITYTVFSLSKVIGITSAFTKVFLLRLLSLLFSWWVIKVFVNGLSKHLNLQNSEKNILHYLTLGLWFIPFLTVRFSSETWSGMFLLLSIAHVYRKEENPNNILWVGLFSGFSFVFRNQMAFAILPLVIYLLPTLFKNKTNLLKYSAGAGIAIGLGFIVDYWFYGEMVFPPYNNYYYNIVEGAAATFGENTPDYYFFALIHFPVSPLGITLLLSLAVLLVFQPKNILPWIVVVFVIGHSFIGHKEARFLFPIAFLSGPILFLACYEIITRFNLAQYTQKLRWPTFILVGSVNLFGAIVMFSSAAGMGWTTIQKYLLEETNSGKTITLLHPHWANPYDPWGGLPNKVYGNSKVKTIRVEESKSFQDSLQAITNNSNIFLIVRRANLADEPTKNFIEQNGFIFKKKSIPSWLSYINKNHKSKRYGNGLLLYEKEQ